MDYKFLDKVVDHIVSETKIDHDKKRIFSPFLPSYISSLPFSFSPPYDFPFSLPFSDHCRNIYGLNEREIDYVWEEYVGIIIDIINNPFAY